MQSYTRNNTWTIPQIIAEFGVTRQQIRRYIDAGKFPRPVQWDSKQGSARYKRFDREAVEAVLKDHRFRSSSLEYRLPLTHAELDLVRHASRLVYMTPDRYMIEVIKNHSKKVVDAVAMEHDD